MSIKWLTSTVGAVSLKLRQPHTLLLSPLLFSSFCLFFAVTALAFKLDIVISQALYFYKLVINFIWLSVK